LKIALDAMGGDLAPKATVEGAVMAARDFGLEVVMVGDRAILQRELAEHDAAALAITIEHASEVVEMGESPIESVLVKPHSSIHVGYDLVKSGAVDGFVGAGNSGAMMAAAMAILGDLPGIDRPAIASAVPTSAEPALLIDAGANVDVKPQNLVEFAVMGTVYCRRVRKIARPRVGILSNGEEDSKGNDLTRAAAATLRAMAPHMNYIGYVEGRDINRGKADVVVTDGFTGNVALKTMEGFASFMVGNLREIFVSSLRGRIAYLLIRKRMARMRERLDPAEYGGAPLLGANGVVIISHGSSNALAIRNALRAAANQAIVRDMSVEISEMMGRVPAAAAAASAKPSGKGIRALFSRMRERLHRHPRDSRADADQSRKQASPHGVDGTHEREPVLTSSPTATPSQNGLMPSENGSRSRKDTGELKGDAGPTDPNHLIKH
jgi:phosphate acyltransferase